MSFNGHGRVVSPASRASMHLPEWLAGSLEANKFFPAADIGLTDPAAPHDVPGRGDPLRDGRIASAGFGEALILDGTTAPDGSPWRGHPVRPDTGLPVTWSLPTPHLTRRFAYFVTRRDWNPDLPLTREQFEPEPFHVVQSMLDPYWDHVPALTPADPTRHTVPLPDRTGRHVLLAVWEIADGAHAFYQVVDLDFGGVVAA
ncbi:lytic polysaccharide monooxygenase auxiliary activity family 9 protein (plasmid) [Streptomyces sp. BI20]|uniref:lytic polysaccharide monooxygenase auxiliary activity family 9 protein n=1 Tax=Streptomyces sp. BI20 TaxID=3403460 RepID=UPI003C767A8C